MKKDRSKIITIEKSLFPNIGQGHLDGETFRVKGGLPGQTIKFLPGKKMGTYRRGKFLELIDQSPLEVESLCPSFPDCGGCTYQSLTYKDEEDIKKQSLEELFNQKINFHSNPKPMAYRNKMEYTFGDPYKGGPLNLGMHRRGRFNDVVETCGCNLVVEDFEIIRKGVLDYFREKETPFYRKIGGEGFLRNLLVRYSHSRKEIMVLLSIASGAEFDQGEYLSMLQSLELEGEIKSAFICINDDPGDVLQCEELDLIYGQDYITEDLMGLEFKITPFSFFQPNVFTAEIIYSRALDFVDQGEGLVFDLFSGTGTLSQLVANKAKKVIGVEIVEEAVQAAKENAKANGVENVEFISGDVLKVLDDLKDKAASMIIDPPRSGIVPKALEKILDFEPEKFIYISCNPSHLVKDIEHFKNRGYKLTELEAIDQFTRTPHVEVIALLEQ